LIDPVDSLVDLGCIVIRDAAVNDVLNGAFFSKDDVVDFFSNGQKTVKIVSKDKKLIAIADIDVDSWYIKYYNVFNN
jgi:tRNA U55 pseudouridine synthase TruB